MADARLVTLTQELREAINSRIRNEDNYIAAIKTGLLYIINNLQVCTQDAVDHGIITQQQFDTNVAALTAQKNRLIQEGALTDRNTEHEDIITNFEEYAQANLRKPVGINPHNNHTAQHIGWRGGWKSKSRTRRSSRRNR